MGSVDRVISTGRRGATRLRRRTESLGLTVSGLWALAVGVIALGAAAVVFGGVAEDVTQGNGLAKHDLADLRIFTDHRSEALVRTARMVTDFGSVASVLLVAIGVGFLLWWLGLPVVLAAAPAFSLAVAAVSAEIAKQLVGRGRPPVSLRLATETGASFPSGHATNSAAMYLTLGLVVAVFLLRRPLARVAIVASSGLVTAAVGASRLELGLHWPTDVLAGWALGTTVALAVTIAVTLMARSTPAEPGPQSGALGRASWRLRRTLALRRSGAHRPDARRAA